MPRTEKMTPKKGMGSCTYIKSFENPIYFPTLLPKHYSLFLGLSVVVVKKYLIFVFLSFSAFAYADQCAVVHGALACCPDGDNAYVINGNLACMPSPHGKKSCTTLNGRFYCCPDEYTAYIVNGALVCR